MDDQIMRHETQEAGEVRMGREIKKKAKGFSSSAKIQTWF